MKKQSKSGFTLAEVLITIGIIGVVATLTMGVIIPKVQKESAGTKLKKFFSSINQAMIMATNENGGKPELPRSDYTYKQNVQWLEINILPYIKYFSLKN